VERARTGKKNPCGLTSSLTTSKRQFGRTIDKERMSMLKSSQGEGVSSGIKEKKDKKKEIRQSKMIRLWIYVAQEKN